MFKGFELKKSTTWLIVGALILLMVILVLMSKDVQTNDSHEYINIAKTLSGTNNIKLQWTHSAIYPWLASFILVLIPSLKAFQMLGIVFLVLTGFLIWHYSKSEKALLLWFFSPIVWRLAGTIHPMIFSSLFFFLAYIWLKKHEESSSMLVLAISGLFLGLSCATSETTWPYSLFFILIFMYNKRFKDFLLFAIMFGTGFGVKLVVDYFIFGYWHFSIFRFWAQNYVIMLGNNPKTKIYILMPLFILLSFFVINPLQYLLYKIYKKGMKAELLFILVSFAFFLLFFTTGWFYHLFPLAAIMIYLLAKVITKKQVMLAILISLPIMVAFVYPAFDAGNENYVLEQDAKLFLKEFDYDLVVADRDFEPVIAAAMWSEKPYVIWLDEYNAWLNDDPVLVSHQLKETPKIANYKIVDISVSYFVNLDKDYRDDLPFITTKGREVPLEGYGLVKCYEMLCVYEKN